MKTYKDVEGYFSFEPFYNYIGDNFLKNGMNIIEIGAFWENLLYSWPIRLRAKDYRLTL
jgi:hypothetical protein